MSGIYSAQNINDDFVEKYGERPDKRSKMELLDELTRAESKVKRLKDIILACECYESTWEGYTAGNERGKRIARNGDSATREA